MLFVLASAVVIGQDSLSAPAAQELSTLLADRKLEAMAAKDPQEPDRFVAALFFPENQLLVVSARYAAPSLMDERIAKQQYREIYADLQGASIPESKVFFQDLGADGLHPEAEQVVDLMYEKGVTQTIFNGPKKGVTEKAYAEKFRHADATYSRLLSLLIGELRKSSL
jgi:hypothetical protein